MLPSMPPRDGPILALNDLRKSFGDTKAVAGVTASFGRGEYVCVLGPSGCGKTTLLRLIAGFEQPTSGDIELDGRSLVGVPPERRDVNVVFQSYALFPHLSVRENVAFGPRMKGVPASEIDQRVTTTLQMVRVLELADRRPGQLSGGQQQRVALARALVNRPKVLVLDEPLSALDRSLRLAMQDELRAVQRRTGVTFIHITHDQSEALTLADQLVVMHASEAHNYVYAALTGAHLALDDGTVLDSAHVYLGKRGHFAVDGSAVALAAIAAEGRRLTALLQGEVLDLVRARLAPESDLAAFVAATVDDAAERARRIARLAAHAIDAVHPPHVVVHEPTGDERDRG